MTMTAQQRAEISRANGARSRGPKTDAGKSVSRRNSLKDGFYARSLALPDEDPDALAARGAQWAGFFQPKSPDAQFLLNECIHATIMADRFHRAHDTELRNQIEDLIEEWDKARQQLVKKIRGWMHAEPWTALADLMGFSHGCRWLIRRWRELGDALEEHGCWSPAECDEAIRLLGHYPEPEQLARKDEAYLACLFNLRCQPVPLAAAIEALVQPECRPAAYRDHDRAAMLPPLS